MTRALLTKKFVDALSIGGFLITVDVGGITASVFKDEPGDLRMPKLVYVGKLAYKDQSVDYDELMRLVRKAA